MELLQLLQQVGMAVYFIWDHLIWLGASGIIDKTNLGAHLTPGRIFVFS